MILKNRILSTGKFPMFPKKADGVSNWGSILQIALKILYSDDTSSSSSTMAFKSPCLVPSSCSCGGNGNTCKSLRCGSEIQKKDKAAAKSPRKIDLGPVPSPTEVDAAVTALQSYLQGVFSHESIAKWLQPVLNFNDSRILHSDGYQLIYKAFQWLLTDPAFKGMVVSLCMDKAVWNAIVNNGFMENFQELPSSGENGYSGSSKQGPDFGNIILRWILEMSLTKVVELIESFLIMLNNAFHFPGKGKLTPEKKDDIDEKIRSSFALSLIIMLMVVVARAQIA